MKILLSESTLNTVKDNFKRLCRDFFVGVRRGILHLHLLKTSNSKYYAIVLLPNNEYGYIPKSAYKGVKKVEVQYHNGTVGLENRPDVDENDVIKIDDAEIEDLKVLTQIVIDEISGFNSRLKYTNA